MVWHLNSSISVRRILFACRHEYGLFGGPAGGHLLKLLGDLRMPVVTTLHTVLKDPAPEYRAVHAQAGRFVRQTGGHESQGR